MVSTISAEDAKRRVINYISGVGGAEFGS